MILRSQVLFEDKAHIAFARREILRISPFLAKAVEEQLASRRINAQSAQGGTIGADAEVIFPFRSAEAITR
jgi:hypothetical protein